MKIAHLFQGVEDKLAVFADLAGSLGIGADACGYMGDDWPDLPVMLRCGFATAPANAHPEVIARTLGGRGPRRSRRGA
jgi:3-deoxy-D-manno-octulosonate 8-phosphate phosphatase (KDO 8-P phosphatase)